MKKSFILFYVLIIFITIVFLKNLYSGNPESQTPQYPSAIITSDTATGIPQVTSSDTATVIWANRIRNEINALQDSIGINPQGSTLSSLRLRLNNIMTDTGWFKGYDTSAYWAKNQAFSSVSVETYVNSANVLFQIGTDTFVVMKQGIGIGTLAPAHLLDIDGNLNVDTIYAMNIKTLNHSGFGKLAQIDSFANRPVLATMIISDNITDTDCNKPLYGLINNLQLNISNDSLCQSLFGIQNKILVSDSYTFYNDFFGIGSVIENDSNSIIISENSDSAGANFLGLLNNNKKGQINTFFNFLGVLRNNSSGTITNSGNFNSLISNDSTGNMSDVININIITPNNQGTMSNVYGLRIENQSDTTQNIDTGYNIYSEGSNSINYFEGKIISDSIITAPTIGTAGQSVFYGNGANLTGITSTGSDSFGFSFSNNTNGALTYLDTTRKLNIGTHHSNQDSYLAANMNLALQDSIPMMLFIEDDAGATGRFWEMSVNNSNFSFWIRDASMLNGTEILKFERSTTSAETITVSCARMIIPTLKVSGTLTVPDSYTMNTPVCDLYLDSASGYILVASTTADSYYTINNLTLANKNMMNQVADTDEIVSDGGSVAGDTGHSGLFLCNYSISYNLDAGGVIMTTSVFYNNVRQSNLTQKQYVDTGDGTEDYNINGTGLIYMRAGGRTRLAISCNTAARSITLKQVNFNLVRVK